MYARLRVKIQRSIEICVVIDAEHGFNGVAIVARAVDRDGRQSGKKAAVRHNGQLPEEKRHVTIVVEPHHLYTFSRSWRKVKKLEEYLCIAGR